MSSEAASGEEPSILGLIESAAAGHRSFAPSSSSIVGELQSTMTVVAPSLLPLFFFPKLRNLFLNPIAVPLGDVVGAAP